MAPRLTVVGSTSVFLNVDSFLDTERHALKQGIRKVDVRLPGKGNLNAHGARLVHKIITMIQWIWSSRLSIKNSLLEQDNGNLVVRFDDGTVNLNP